MRIHARKFFAGAAIALVSTLPACGGPLDDFLDDIVDGHGPAEPPHPPVPPPILVQCTPDLPPPPPSVGDGACPLAGSACLGNVEPMFPCIYDGVGATVRCDGLAGWRIDMLECGPNVSCVSDLPPPPPSTEPGGGACPATGSPCPGGLPPLLLCRYGGVDAAMACDEDNRWRLDMLECE